MVQQVWPHSALSSDVPGEQGAGGRGLAGRPVVDHAQLGSGDAHLVPTGGVQVGGEVDQATLILHILEFTLLRWLHVDHRVFVDVFL